MSPEYPLCSRSWLLYYGRRYDTNTYKYKNEMLLLPQYNQPKTVHLNPNDTGYYKAEYFYYHNNNFIIYHRQAYGQDHVGIEIYLRNGDYHQTIKLKIEGCYDHSYARLYLSSNGRYIFYCEAVKIEPDNPNNYETKTVGKIVELTYDAKTLEFKFETKRTIEDFKERYNKQAGEINTYNYYYGNGMEYDFFVTDNQELLFFDKTNGKIMYEEMDCAKDLEKKLGKRDYNEEEYRTISDMTWYVKNGGFACHSSEQVFFIRINSELRKIMPMIKINFQINKGQMSISKV